MPESDSVRRFTFFTIVRQPRHPRRKTDRYLVFNSRAGSVIGEISWYSRWRQYCFLPAANTAWSASCLREMNAFLDERNGR